MTGWEERREEGKQNGGEGYTERIRESLGDPLFLGPGSLEQSF